MSAQPTESQRLVNELMHTYQILDADTLSNQLLAKVYHPEVCFIDPLHQQNGLVALEAYFAKLYRNVSSIRFEFEQQLVSADQAFLQWQMHYSHPKLNKGQEIVVNGVTHLQFQQGLIKLHRDYFDAGNMLYEQIPLLGSVISWLKRRLA